jgi:RNase P subunit RPR2
MYKTIALQIVESTPEGYRKIKPFLPVSVSSDTNHYVCGRCSTLLVIGNPAQLRGIVIECRECNALNKVDL